MPRRFQFSLRALLVLMFGIACFFGGIRFGRDRQKSEDVLAEQIARKEWRTQQAAKLLQELDEVLDRDLPSPQTGADLLELKPRVIPDVVWENIPTAEP